MYLFVTLLMKRKISGSNNQHFHFTGKWKQGVIHLRSSTFGTFELIEKLMLGKWLCQDALSKVHINKSGSYFNSILLLSSDKFKQYINYHNNKL